MDFPCTLLRKTNASGIPAHVLYLDTETETVPRDGAELQITKLCWTCGVQYTSDGNIASEKWRRWADGYSLCKYLDQLARPKTTIYVFAHNIFFDLQASGFFKHFARFGWILKFYYEKGVTYILICTKDSAVMKCVSTTNFFPFSVKVLGGMVGLEKLEVDLDNVDNETLSVYCKRDVEIIKRAMEQYFHFILEHDLGQFACARVSQAFRAYRHRFMDKKIYIHHDKSVQALERDAYMGGRVECFHLGELTDGPFVTLDVNSMYPYVMKKYQVPVKLVDHCKEISPSRLEKLLNIFCIVARVVIKTYQPIYPLRINHKAVYPIGEFECVLCTPSLQEAVKRGHIIEVKEMAVYEKDYIFDKFVDFFYRLKSKYHVEGRKVERELAKRLMNGLYGKWAQKRDSVEESIEECFDGYFREETTDAVTGKTELVYRMLNKSVTIFGDEQDILSFTAISAHITDAARMHLWDIIETTGIEKVLYCDTDSIKIRQSDLASIKHPISDTLLGGLKIEETSETLEIYGLKSYIMNGKRTLKGIPLTAVQIEPNSFSYTQFLKQATHMRERIDEGFIMRQITKVLRGEYDKGNVLPTGRVVPFVFSLTHPPC